MNKLLIILPILIIFVAGCGSDNHKDPTVVSVTGVGVVKESEINALANKGGANPFLMGVVLPNKTSGCPKTAVSDLCIKAVNYQNRSIATQLTYNLWLRGESARLETKNIAAIEEGLIKNYKIKRYAVTNVIVSQSREEAAKALASLKNGTPFINLLSQTKLLPGAPFSSGKYPLNNKMRTMPGLVGKAIDIVMASPQMGGPATVDNKFFFVWQASQSFDNEKLAHKIIIKKLSPSWQPKTECKTQLHIDMCN